MDFSTLLLERPATSQHSRRQLGMAGDVTPDMLSQIDWNDKSTRAPLTAAVNYACLVLIALFVSTRLIVRCAMTRHFFLDDAFVAVATFFTIGLCAMTILALNYGFGLHVWLIDISRVVDDVKKCVQLMFVGNIFYASAITFTKLSIMASYLRIFPYNTLRIGMYVTGAVTIGLFIASIPVTIFQCNPVPAAWDFNIKGAVCYDFINFLYVSTAVNVTTDLVLCVAPLPYFWNLHLPKKQKIIVSSLFFIGGFACVANIIRLTFLTKLSKTIDVTYELSPPVLWTIAECTIGICCVSVPPMRPLFSKLYPTGYLTRHPYNRTGDSGRREAYALGSWSKRTPISDVENKATDPDLAGEEEVPASWLTERDTPTPAAVLVRKSQAVVIIDDDEDVVESPEPVRPKT